MKKAIVFMLMLCGLQLTMYAQDIIIRKDGSEISAKMLEVSTNEIKYKRFDNLEGPVYSENKNLILKIKYANGTEDIFVTATDPSARNVVWQDVPQVKKPSKVRYSGLVELSPYLGFDYTNNSYHYHANGTYESVNGHYGVSFSTTHGIQLMDKYFFGIGIGINSKSEGEVYVPFYTTFRLDLSPAPTRPFLSFSLGAQFGDFDYNDYYDEGYITLGVWANAMFGYRFKNKLYAAIGITIQNANVYSDSYRYEWYRDEIYGMVGLMAGFGIRF